MIDLPWHHWDSFDRLLIAQALSDNLRIATADPAFSAYGIDVLLNITAEFIYIICMAVLTWFSEHVALLSALTSLAMVFIWLFYANLFYKDFKSRHHPRIMIHQAPDKQIDSMCIVINMGSDMVNIGCIIAAVYTEQDTKTMETTDYRHFSTDKYEGREIKSILKQGPLGSGDFIHIGPFEKIIDSTGIPKEQIQKIEVRTILYYGSEAKPVGALRDFLLIEKNGKLNIVPATVNTIQMHSRRQRKVVIQRLEETIFSV